MKNLLYLLILILPVQTVNATENLQQLYSRLEQALNSRGAIDRQKEARIDSIQNLITPDMSTQKRFDHYQTLYQEYLTYRADSALFYIDMAEDMALRNKSILQQNQCGINRATILATTGYFSQALSQLQHIHKENLDSTLLADYYKAYEWVYSVWSEYTDDEYYAPRYRKKEILYNDSLLQVLTPGSHEYHYWTGEYKARTGDQAGAQKAYEKALQGVPINTRLYAQITCGLAFAHNRQGHLDEYERFLILSAISDNVCPLKENLSLQELALHIFRQKPEWIERANRYLQYSMEDATFYNNRLRMLEIARKFPAIVNAYQQETVKEREHLTAAVIFISALTLLLIVSLIVIRRQLKKVSHAQQALSELNQQLTNLNDELLKTNHIREEYVSLFLDLCASYIDKLNRYQELVKRKVKAKQADDLLKQNSTRMSEADTKRFFVNFDTAFLTLYPTFITEFNALLRPGEEIYPQKGDILNTELRIFALVRMGIRDSARIATLMFYSPQTIYNYRTSVRNRAKNREEFEEQIKQLCQTVQ